MLPYYFNYDRKLSNNVKPTRQIYCIFSHDTLYLYNNMPTFKSALTSIVSFNPNKDPQSRSLSVVRGNSSLSPQEKVPCWVRDLCYFQSSQQFSLVGSMVFISQGSAGIELSVPGSKSLVLSARTSCVFCPILEFIA